VEGISNWEVLNALEEGTYLRKYLEYAASQTDAPWLYHVGAGLAALATVAPPTVRVWHHGHWLYGNLWIMLVGKSGRDRKTTAVRIATDLVSSVNPDLLGTPPGSSQGLQESLIEKPYQMIPMEELGDHLAQTRNRGMEDIRTTMNIAYDGGPIGRTLAAGTKKSDSVRLTVLGGTTPAYLESYTDETARTGGYLNRYGMMLARREHHLATVVPDEARRVIVAEHLLTVHKMECPFGALGFTDEAAAIWTKWGQGVEIGVSLADQEIAGAIARAQEFALKVALLISIAENVYNPAAFWPIDAPALRLAIKIAGWHVRGTDQIMHNLAGTQFQRNRRKLLQFLEGETKTRGHIQRYLKMPPREVETLLQALKQEGRILSEPQGILPAWKLLTEAETEAVESVEARSTIENMAASGVHVLGVSNYAEPSNEASTNGSAPTNGAAGPALTLVPAAQQDSPPAVAASVDPDDYNT